MWFTVYLFYFYCNFNNSWLWYEFGCHVGRWSCLVEIKEKKPIKYWLYPFKHAFVRWFGCWHLRIDLQQNTALQIVIFWVLLWYGRSWIGLAKNSRLKLSRNRLAWAARLYCIWTDRNASLHNGNLRSEAKAFYLQKSQKLNLKQKFYTYSGRSLLLFLTLISFEVVVLVYLVVCLLMRLVFSLFSDVRVAWTATTVAACFISCTLSWLNKTSYSSMKRKSFWLLTNFFSVLLLP